MLSSVVLRCVLSVSGCFHPQADIPESSDPESRCRCRRMIDPSSVNVEVPTEPKRNLAPAPSHYAPTTAAANTSIDFRSGLSKAILVFHNSNGGCPEQTLATVPLLDRDREQFACHSTFRTSLLRQDLFAVCASVQKLLSSVPATAPPRDCHQCFQLVDLRPRSVQL